MIKKIGKIWLLNSNKLLYNSTIIIQKFSFNNNMIYFVFTINQMSTKNSFIIQFIFGILFFIISYIFLLKFELKYSQCQWLICIITYLITLIYYIFVSPFIISEELLMKRNHFFIYLYFLVGFSFIKIILVIYKAQFKYFSKIFNYV